MKSLRKFLSIFIIVLMVVQSVTPSVFAASGISQGLYGVLDKDEQCPYMIVVKSGTNYYAYKSSTPIWYVYDENKLVVTQSGTTIKKFNFSTSDNTWKVMKVYVPDMSPEGIGNIDDNTSTTFNVADITDVAGTSAGTISGKDKDGNNFSNSYGDNVLNHNVKNYLVVSPLAETNQQRAEQVAAGLQVDVLGLQNGDIPSSIKSNLNLKTTGNLYGYPYSLTWSSNNFAVIGNSGVVVRQKEDINVQLTASVNVSGAIAPKTFYLTVEGDDESPADKGARIVDNLTVSNLNLIPGDTLDNITNDFTPIKTVTDSRQTSGGTEITNFNISWSSSDVGVASVNGTTGEVNITRPTFANGDKFVNLIATVNGVSKYFRLRVIKQPEPSSSRDIRNLYSLTYTDLGLDSTTAKQVISNITLPSNKDGTSLIWTTDNPAITINGNTAQISRPNYLQPSAIGNLYAEISGQPNKMEFFVKVLKDMSTEPSNSKRERVITNLNFGDMKTIPGGVAINTETLPNTFSLPTTIDGETIKWVSSNPSILNYSNGVITVTKPLFGDGNKYVTLTASSSDDVYSQTFRLLVQQENETNTQKEVRYNSLVGLSNMSNIDTTSVSSNFNVSTIIGGSLMTWKLDGANVVGNTVNISTTGTPQTKILQSNLGVNNRSFTLHIPSDAQAGLTPVQKAQSDFNKIAENFVKTMTYNDLGFKKGDTSATITGDLYLPDKIYLYNSVVYTGTELTRPAGSTVLATVSFVSSDLGLISNNGDVTRDMLDKVGALTATVIPEPLPYDSNGDSTPDAFITTVTDGKNTKLFDNLIVKNTNYKKINETDVQKIDRFISNIGVGKDSKGNNQGIVIGATDTLFSIRNDIDFDGAVEGTPIIWSKLNKVGDGDIDVNTGNVTRGTVDTSMTLRATITVGVETRTKDFKVWVLANGNNVPKTETDTEKATRLANEMNLDSIDLNEGDSYRVSKSLSLVAQIKEYFLPGPSYNISWVSSNLGVMGSNGNVITPPSYIENYKTLNLTGTVNVNGETATRDFTLNVSKGLTISGYDVTKKRYIKDVAKSLEGYFDENGLFRDMDGNNSRYFTMDGTPVPSAVMPNDVGGEGFTGLNFKKYYDQNGSIKDNYELDYRNTKLIHADRIRNELSYDSAMSVDFDTAQKIKNDFNLISGITINDGEMYDGLYSITWTSDKPGVVSIDNGTGEATVTRSGSDQVVTLTPTVKFIDSIGQTVSSNPVPITNPITITVLSNAGFSETVDERNQRILNELDSNILGLTEAKLTNGITDADVVVPSINYTDNGTLINNLITWTTSDATLLDVDGTKNNPSYSTGDKYVTLSANIGAYQRDFLILLKAKTPDTLEDEQENIRNLKLSDIGFGVSESIDNVITNVTLPAGFTWESSVPTVLSNTGVVNTGSISDNTLITLTGYSGPKLNAETEFRMKKFLFTVVKNPQKDLVLGDLVGADYNYISTNIINSGLIQIDSNETLNTIENSFTLAKTVNYKGVNVPVTWTDASNYLTINPGTGEATFTRNPSSGSNQNVTLRATVGGVNKDFSITILKEFESEQALANRLATTVLNTRELGLTKYEPVSAINNVFKLQKTLPEYPSATISWNTGTMPLGWISDGGTEMTITPVKNNVPRNITLTATVDVNGKTDTKIYNITIGAIPTPKPAVKIVVNSNMVDRVTNTKPVQLLKTDLTKTSMFDIIFLDEDNNPVTNPNSVTWSIPEIDSLVDTGIEIDNTGTLSVNRQMVLDYRESVNDGTKFSLITITAKGKNSLNQDLTTGTMKVDLQIELVPPKATGELIASNTFDAATLYLGKYAPFITSNVHQYRTLVNYGEYQLMYYTNIKPVLKQVSGETFLGFGTGSTVNMQIYKSLGSSDWVKLNEYSGAESGTSKIVLNNTINNIEYINYDLLDSGNSLIQRANINSNNDGLLPELKMISLPNFDGLKNAYNYILSRGISGYYLITASQPITITGNSVSYPGIANYYTLVQDKWVLCDNNAILQNDYKLLNKPSFLNALKYTDNTISGVSPNFDKIIYNKPNFISNIQEYSSSSASNNYIIIDSPIYGVRALEFPNTISVVNGRLKLSDGSDINQVFEKIFNKGIWVTNNESTNNFIDGNGFYTRMDVLSSVRISSTDILDSVNQLIFNSLDKSTVNIYKDFGKIDKLPITEPVDVAGKPFSIVVYEDGMYRAYYSKIPFYLYQTNIVLRAQDGMGNDFAVDVYDYNTGTWAKNSTDSKVLVPNINSNTLAQVSNNLPLMTKWTSSDILNAENSDVFIYSVPKSERFSTGSYIGYLDPNSNATSYLDQPYYVMDRQTLKNYWMGRYNVKMSNTPTDTLTSVENTNTNMFVPNFGKWTTAVYLEFKTGQVVGKISNYPQLDHNLGEFAGSGLNPDKTAPEIKAVYLYNGELYILADDKDPTDPTKERKSGLSTIPYGFTYDQNIINPFDVVGYLGTDNTPSIFPKDNNIPIGTSFWKVENNQKVDFENQSTRFVLKVRDKDGNISLPLTIDAQKGQNNTILFGSNNVPQIIKDQIDAANSGSLEDRDAPVIYGVYMYKDELYIVGEDKSVGPRPASGLHEYAYGYQFTQNAILPFDINAKNVQGNKVEIPGGSIIAAGTEFYNIENKQRLGRDVGLNLLVDATIQVKLRDANGNIAIAGGAGGFNITDDKNNTVIWENPAYPGGISDIIKLMLEAEKNKGNGGGDTNQDKSAPEIVGVYMYKGELCLIVKEDRQLATVPYGFEWANSSQITEDLTGVDSNGNPINIPKGGTIAAGTLVYKTVAKQRVSVPSLINIKVRDAAGNLGLKQVLVTTENGVLFGEVPDAIKNLIDKETGGGGTNPPANTDKNPPIITKIYTSQGKLFVEGYDDVELASKPYGFNTQEDMVIDSNYTGDTKQGIIVNIPKGTIIPQFTEIFKSTNNQQIMIPVHFEVILRDKAGNETRKTLYIDKDNWSYVGELPDNPDIGGGEVKPPNPEEIKPVEPGENNGSQIGSGGISVKPGPAFDKVDWNKYDYEVKAIDKKTGLIVYVIKLDKAEDILIPRLEDSTTYGIQRNAIAESDNKLLFGQNADAKTFDSIPPTINKVYFLNGRLYVDAFDKGGLAEKPYNFVIDGATGQSEDKFITNNYVRVLSKDTVKITVLDASKNKTSLTVNTQEFGSSNGEKITAVKAINPINPLIVNKNESKPKTYWVNKFKTDLKLSGDYEILENGTHYKFTGNNMELLSVNTFPVLMKNKTNNENVLVFVKTEDSGRSNRTLIVQTSSQINFNLVFKDKLRQVFGTNNGITWATDNNIISRSDTMIDADKLGVGKIKAYKDGKEVIFYVAVTGNLESVTSKYSFTDNKIPYVFKTGDSFKLSEVLKVSDEIMNEQTKTLQGDFIIFEGSTDGVTKTGDLVSINKEGKHKLQLINVIKDEIYPVEFEVIDTTPHIGNYSDIDNSIARESIQSLAMKGILPAYKDNKFKPENPITIKEFLSILNKFKMVVLENEIDAKNIKDVPLSNKDFDYYQSLNAVTDISDADMKIIFGNSYSLNRPITKKEAIQVISKTIVRNNHHNESTVQLPKDVIEKMADEVWVKDLKHLGGLDIIITSSETNMNPYNRLTKGEYADWLNSALNYFVEPTNAILPETQNKEEEIEETTTTTEITN